MTEAKILFRRLDELTRDPNNARTHSSEQIEQIVASIERYGWTNPALVDDVIRAGNGRHEAAERIYARGGRIYLAPGEANGGAAIPHETMPVIDISGLPEADRTALALADNKIALNAGWDEDVLSAQLAALASSDFDIPKFVGFDMADIHRLLGKGDGATDPDEVPPEPENAVSRPGDIWIMGEHRIICGSATDPDDVAAVLAGETPHLMVTDPPYGVEYDASWREKAGINGPGGATGQVLNDDRADWAEAWALFRGDVAYIWHAGAHAHTVADSLIATGFDIRSQIIWAKQQMVMSRGDYHWKHEPCWYAVRKGRPGHYVGGRKQTTVWDIDKPHKSETGHSTQKPVECMKRPIENNSKVGDAVYEPFSGSGTTIVAAQITGRRCFAVELNPAYVDLAVARWQAFAEGVATLEATGQTFAEVQAERLAPGA